MATLSSTPGCSVLSRRRSESRCPTRLRPIRQYVDTARIAVSPPLATLYAHTGRPSIAPEKLRRALLLQVLYSLRSERLVMEALAVQPAVPLVCRPRSGRAGVGCDRLHHEPGSRVGGYGGHGAFFAQVLAQATAHRLLSDKPFTVDGRCSKPGRARSASS